MKPMKLSTLRKTLLLLSGFSAALVLYSEFIAKHKWTQRGKLSSDIFVPYVSSRLLKGVKETIVTYRSPEQSNITKNLPDSISIKETHTHPKSKKYYTQVEDLEIFIYSAIAGNSTINSTWDNVVLMGWEHTHYTFIKFTCCLWYQKHGLMSVSGIRKHHWVQLKKANLVAKQFVCSNPGRKWNDILLGITVTPITHSCSNDTNIYVEPIFAYRHREAKLAICNKIVYGSVLPESILEWFEVQRLLGVDKVLTYANSDLNEEARQVLRYYEEIGMAEVLPFLIPMKDKYRRMVGQKSMQAWNDEQVPVFDCLERLRGYKYMGILDLDEFILPVNEPSIPKLLARLFSKDPWAAGFSFNVHIFVTSWGMTNASAEFIVTQYTNRTKPMMDRVKNIFMPSRISPGGVSTHQYVADRSRNYKASKCPSSLGAISHYRTCRREWQKGERNKCDTFVRYRDTRMVNVLEPIKDRVLQLRKKLGITNPFGKVS
ncbi:hypothetical protein CHS0354_030228 [Potamilus streckersoni]|uniref:Glycosyltransferase family 92 protein n=1 Tax=Potamilus streckersoni TaxID=2493646 RepID=A0AAE0VJ59_9BIVA|nr:hypothetical protein CHS0354_030228 [Potamilus streckersoni]